MNMTGSWKEDTLYWVDFFYRYLAPRIHLENVSMRKEGVWHQNIDQ